MEIIKHQNERLTLTCPSEQPTNCFEHPEARLGGVSQPGAGPQSRQALAHLRRQVGNIGRARTEIAERRVGGARLQQRADDLHPRPIGRSACLFMAAAPEHGRPLLRGVFGKFLGRPRLADSGLTGNHDAAPAPRERVIQRSAQHPQFSQSPDEGFFSTSGEGFDRRLYDSLPTTKSGLKLPRLGQTRKVEGVSSSARAIRIDGIDDSAQHCGREPEPRRLLCPCF
jgi:hypothetical protein